VVQMPPVVQVAVGDVNLSDGLALDDEDVIMQQRQSVALLPQEGSLEAEDDDKYEDYDEDDAHEEGEEDDDDDDFNEGDFLMPLEERSMGHQPRAARALASDIKLCGQTTGRIIAGR